MQLKVVQTRLTSLEYELLRRYAESRGLTIMEAVREIIRQHVMEDKVYADDPIFTEEPLVKGRGVGEDVSERHDEILYGGGS